MHLNMIQANPLKITILSVLMMLSCSQVYTADISEKEGGIIYTNVFQLLNSYQDLINQIGEESIKTGETPYYLIDQFNELFLNRKVFVFNDLDPNHQLSEFYEIETYSANLALWYKDGMQVELDLKNARVGQIYDHGQDVYYLDVFVKKGITGNFQNRLLNRNTEDLAMRIAFSLEERKYKDFKIVGIRNSNSTTLINDEQVLEQFKVVSLTENEINYIHEAIKTLLSDYSRSLLFIGNPNEPAEEKKYYIDDFTGFFEDPDSKIYNDLDPEPEQSFMEVASYLSHYIESYPEGIRNLSMSVDSTGFGSVIEAEDNKYFVYAYVTKFFSGNYRQRDAYRVAIDLIFKVAFDNIKGEFDNFKIAGVDKDVIDFYAEEEVEQLNQPFRSSLLRPVSRKGLNFNIYGGYGMSAITDQNIKDFTVESNDHEWDIKPEYNFNAGVELSYQVNNLLGFGLGIEYNRLSTIYGLSGQFQDSETSTDINETEFHKIIMAEYDSSISISEISVPIFIRILTGQPRKVSWYFDLGIQMSYSIQSEYNVSGSYDYSGYYPDNPPVIQYLSIPELGYYSRDEISNSGTIEINKLNFSATVSTGIFIPLGYYKDIYIGPVINYGLTSYVDENKDYTDIFGKTYTRKPVKCNFFGIKLGVRFKL